jgi:hypothetical protein
MEISKVDEWRDFSCGMANISFLDHTYAIFPYLLCNVCTVKIRSTLQNDPFRIISSHFFANYMYIFQKN